MKYLTSSPAQLVAGQLRKFSSASSGQIAILFGLSVTMIVMAAGGGIDLSRAYQARQKLSEIATLACQYASRPPIIETIAPSYSGANGSQTYQNKVNAYIAAAVTNQQLGYQQTTQPNPFTFVVGGPADVSLTASVPTSFMKVARITQMPVAATAHCYDNSAGITPSVPDGSSPNLVQEGFENTACTGSCYVFYSPTGNVGARSTASNTFPAGAGYTGTNGNAWYITGYCVEIDSVGVIKSSVAEGTHSAELDCDNGGGGAGNSSISTKIYMPTGNYELRYNYVSRVSYPDYDPAYICGNTAADVAWANNTRSSGGPVANALRTNQINAYLDLSVGNAPGTHTTIDGTQTLAGGNLIDVCVYSTNWVERSVRIYITTPGDYWLSFAADGQNDSYGGQLDNVRLCPYTCATVLADNFPPIWLAANKLLFEDTFESPAYPGNYYNVADTTGNLNNSKGTSGTATSGWPTLLASGWATAPYNQVNYLISGSQQGTQSIQLDSSSPSVQNHLASRPFLLMPGYYKVEYLYVPDVYFPGMNTAYCGSTPSAANISSLSGSANGTDRFFGSGITANKDTNVVGMFMSHAQLASTPIGGGAVNSQTSYTNPNGTTSTTPTVAPNGVSLTNYNAAQPNPLIDICGYAPSWQARTAYVKIQKPAYYWLTMSALGTADGFGGAVDDIKVTALGSLYMSSPPSSPVTIPVPAPQPSAQVSYSGFYIVADPLLPPAALQ